MPLDAQIVEPVTGEIDAELSAHLGAEEHEFLFTRPEINPEQFPLLSRLKDYYSDTVYANNELEALIAELERAALLFGPDRIACSFLGPFHLLCCLAFIRRKDVALYAD